MQDVEGREEQFHLLETLFRYSPVGQAFVDRDFRVVRMNTALATLLPMPDSPVGRTVQEIAPELWPTQEALLRRALGGEALHGVELRVPVSPEEGVRHWLASYFPVTRRGEVVGVGIVVDDITERKSTEEALSVRNHLYAMLARTHRAVSRCQSADELFAELCTIAVETGRFRFAWIGVAEGDRLVMVASAGTHDGYMDDLVVSLDDADWRSHGPAGRAARTGQSYVVNDLLTSPMMARWREAGRRAGFGASAAFPLREQGRVAAVLTLYASEAGFFHDDLLALDKLYQERERAREEAERRQLEQQFRQAQKMDAVGRLAAGVAHDFNNLLTVINGYSDPALADGFAEEDYRSAMTEIHKAGETAESLTQQLLAFSRRQVIEPRVVSLNAIVADTEKMLRRMLGEDVLLETSLEPSLWMVKADAGQVAQVVINLAVNARDAMPTGGRLTVTTENVLLRPADCASLPGLTPGDHVLLSVRDTGIGMDATTKARLFEPFFTTKGVGKGTGLGLSTVHGIVQQAHGHVAVESELQRGTTFRVYLPRVSASPESIARLAPLSMPVGRETILLVEDQEAVRTLASRVLRSCGYAVLEAANGREALATCAAHPGAIHLLLTDVVMPHLSGRELAERLAVARPDTKVLFMSGYTDDALIRHGVEEAKLAFLRKPFTPPELSRKVRSVLNGEM